MPGTPDANPLKRFLACLDRLRELPEETLVLPSHGLPFRGLHQRIDFLLDHHQKRLSEIEQALEVEQSATELFPLLFNRKLDHQQLARQNKAITSTIRPRKHFTGKAHQQGTLFPLLYLPTGNCTCTNQLC